MEKYIKQLIEDLEHAAQNPPKPYYFATPSFPESNQASKELLETPYKTIEELTGIDYDAFPSFDELLNSQLKALLQSIFEVFDSLYLKLIDIPKGIPKEWLYDAITSRWRQEVQYLPLSGMDMELCNGDSIHCPYGGYCDCEQEWPDDEIHFEIQRIIPHELETLIPRVVKSIESGMVCFFYSYPFELKEIPLAIYEDPDEFYALNGNIADDENCLINFSKTIVKIEPLIKYQAVNMMEDFTDMLDDENLQSKLYPTLTMKNPVEKFNAIILNSKEKHNWLNFRQEWLEEEVRAIIWQELNFLSKLKEMDGIFNDDGSRIDPETIPTPSLCMTCKSFYNGDAQEDMLCLLNRNDQSNEANFKCSSFRSI